MKFTALGHNVLILPEPPQEMTKSGLILPKDTHESIQYGTVVNVPTGHYEFGHWVDSQVQINQRVAYLKGKIRTEIEINGVKHVIVEIHDLIGITTENLIPILKEAQ